MTNVSAGRAQVYLEANSAGQNGNKYGTYVVGVDVVAGITNVLPYTSWLTPIDEDNEVSLSSPTENEVVVTTPAIPGLEVRIPAGAVIRDYNGNVINKVSITRLPIDLPPFPLPDRVEVPVYFTLQPGGAYVEGPNGGFRIIYPNYNNEPPIAPARFWHYDPSGQDWYVYGKGAVSADGSQVVPYPGVSAYSFTGAMFSFTITPPADWPNCCFDGANVDLSSGLVVETRSDLQLSDIIPVNLESVYRPGDSRSRPFGIGATHQYEMYLWAPTRQYLETDLILPDGARVHYSRISSGTGFSDAEFEATTTPSIFYKSRLKWNNAYTIGPWDLTLKDGTVYIFGDEQPLQAIRDRLGNQIRLVRTNGQTGNIAKIVSPSGRFIDLTYDASDRITQAKDNIGRTVTYTYDASGRLWKATNAAGGVTEYTYDASHRMLTVKDPKGVVALTNEYDANGRVTRQTGADSSVYQYAYTLDGNGKVTQTDVTDPLGFVRRATFNSSAYKLTDIQAVGRPEQQTTTYERQTGTHRVTAVIDQLGRRTNFVYDGMGNPTSITRLAGTAEAVTTTFTYEPKFNQLASVTDPLSHSTSLSYDTLGSLTTVADALNNQTTFSYNAAGQPLSVTDALNKTTQFGYDMGDLVSVTNPLGQTSQRFVDGAGRTLYQGNALGQTTAYEYDALSRLTKTIDAAAGVTTLTYDANSNLLSLRDARNNLTSYSYNNMNRVATRTDPLLRVDSYEYDLEGSLVKFTDRRGKITRYSYDALGRRTFAGYGEVAGSPPTYESTVSDTLDGGNRLTQAIDSVAGTTTHGFDNLDRITSEVTPQGTVSYAYDTAGRRSSMTVAGQSAVSYSYDNANRLTTITQGSSTVSYAYDTASRKTSLTLPNGIRMEYGYSDASQMNAITYKLGSNTLGDLSYEYDSAGKRTKVGGSYARSGLPQAVTSATHDAANQLTQSGTSSLTYDANGNMTGDGTSTYTWNARNQLASIAGGSTASFQYDPFGRRNSKTIGGQSTQFLYDGLNPIQELTGGSPTANMLTGLGVDEYLTRTDSVATTNMLTDSIGSTIALSDSAAVLQTEYTFEPFGKASSTGVANSNSFQYTGRENDGTGLQYYRARYHDPKIGRFISEDPIGFAGGDVNLYAYVGNDPVNAIDPLGLELVKVMVVTVIRPPHSQAGTKSIQSLVLDTETGQVSRAPTVVGFTGIRLGLGLYSGLIQVRGIGRFFSSASVEAGGSCSFLLLGSSRSLFLPLNIDYVLAVDYDPATGTGLITGAHDGFPSYEVYVDGKRVYDHHQQLPVVGKLGGMLDIAVKWPIVPNR